MNVSLKHFADDLKLTQHKSTILHFLKKSIKGEEQEAITGGLQPAGITVSFTPEEPLCLPSPSSPHLK